MRASAGMPTTCRPRRSEEVWTGVSISRSMSMSSLMCAEAVPWRCHRSLVADALLVRGIAVSEITSGVRTRPHSLTPWAEVDGIQLTYPDAAP